MNTKFLYAKLDDRFHPFMVTQEYPSKNKGLVRAGFVFNDQTETVQFARLIEPQPLTKHVNIPGKGVIEMPDVNPETNRQRTSDGWVEDPSSFQEPAAGEDPRDKEIRELREKLLASAK